MPADGARPLSSQLSISSDMSADSAAAASALRFATRADKPAVETGTGFAPKFDKDGLMAAVATDALSGEVLMVAWMNEESLRLTLVLGEAVYYSRSRRELWHKGATSGNVQKIVEILTDCDQDALVLRVHQIGTGACHTGRRSCFYRRIVPGSADPVTMESVTD
jgi:phosphoribosyl-AMP cyclohydrolase